MLVAETGSRRAPVSPPPLHQGIFLLFLFGFPDDDFLSKNGRPLGRGARRSPGWRAHRAEAGMAMPGVRRHLLGAGRRVAVPEVIATSGSKPGCFQVRPSPPAGVVVHRTSEEWQSGRRGYDQLSS